MVNYMDPQVILSHAQIFNKIMLVIQGFYTWEIIVTLWYDWEVVRGKRNFKWPMVIYWYARYTMFFATVGIAIANNYSGELNCQSLYTFNQFVGNSAIGGASTLLMLRTMAIWSQNMFVVAPLVVLSLGQWGILLHGVTTVKAEWNASANQCVINATLPVFLRLLYIYTMSFDFVILCLSTIGLIRTRSRRTGLWALLFADGVVYFLVAFTVNFGAAFMLLLDLNPILNIILAVPAAAISCTVACRSFVRLSTFANKDVYVHSSQAVSATKYSTAMSAGRKRAGSRGTPLNVMSGGGVRSEPFALGGHAENGISTGEIHEIQMETYGRVDESKYSLPGTEDGNKVEVIGAGDESDNGHVSYRSDRKPGRL